MDQHSPSELMTEPDVIISSKVADKTSGGGSDMPLSLAEIDQRSGGAIRRDDGAAKVMHRPATRHVVAKVEQTRTLNVALVGPIVNSFDAQVIASSYLNDCPHPSCPDPLPL